MSVQVNNITKLCSFYISDWHLVTMLLPYINRKVNEQAKIATILEKNIKENITTLIQKLNLKNKDNILSINWNKTNGENKIKIRKILKNSKEEKEIIIILNGNKDFIEKENIKIEQYINKEKITNKKIKIINCYEIIEFNGNVDEILRKNDKILNTSGEKEICEIFENYKEGEKEVI